MIADERISCVDTPCLLYIYNNDVCRDGFAMWRRMGEVASILILTMCVCACVPMTLLYSTYNEACVSENTFKPAKQHYFVCNCMDLIVLCNPLSPFSFCLLCSGCTLCTFFASNEKLFCKCSPVCARVRFYETQIRLSAFVFWGRRFVLKAMSVVYRYIRI